MTKTTLRENDSQLTVFDTNGRFDVMSEVKEDERRLVVNGQATTQEAIRVNANAVLAAWPGVDDLAADLADTILALLDLLEAGQDLIDHSTGLDDVDAAS